MGLSQTVDDFHTLIQSLPIIMGSISMAEIPYPRNDYLFNHSSNIVASASSDVARTSISTSLVAITADQVLMRNLSGATKSFNDVAVLADITASGAGGLDTGIEEISTHYYFGLIGKEDGTVVALLSKSLVGSWILPSGYTYWIGIGSVRNRETGAFEQFLQVGNRVDCRQRSVMAGGTALTYTPVNMSNVVPKIARSVKFQVNAENTGGDAAIAISLAPSGSGTASEYSSTTRQDSGLKGGSASTDRVAEDHINLLTRDPPTIWYRVASGSGGGPKVYGLNVRGWLL